MGLNFLRSSDEHKLSPEAKQLLEGYMAGAVKEIGFGEQNKAKTKAEKYAADFYKSGKAEGLTKADVKAMEKHVAKDLKKYGLKERLDYFTNASGNKLLAFELGLAAVAVGAAACQGIIGDTATLGIAGASLGSMVTSGLALGVNMAFYGDERKLDEYVALKQAQLALKKLKREFTNPEHAERSELASKLLTQAAALKNQKASR